MKKLTSAGGKERRAEFYRLRLSGMSKFEAATAVGVSDTRTISLYEQWFRAEHPEVPAEPPRRRYNPYRAGSASLPPRPVSSTAEVRGEG